MMVVVLLSILGLIGAVGALIWWSWRSLQADLAALNIPPADPPEDYDDELRGDL